VASKAARKSGASEGTAKRKAKPALDKTLARKKMKVEDAEEGGPAREAAAPSPKRKQQKWAPASKSAEKGLSKVLPLHALNAETWSARLRCKAFQPTL
jgi:hypothetical protein